MSKEKKNSKLPIGEKEIAEAAELLLKYKNGKQNLENRIVEEEKWWKLRHWDTMNKSKDSNRPEPASAWLFNSIANKHADAMDNYPEPNVLPRERQDEETAKTLSTVLPVIIERNNFESVYSDAWWYKLKHGAVCYGVIWEPSLENGIGDISIRQIDILNVFWKPGISDIQDTPNLFIVSFADEEELKRSYPQLGNKDSGKVVNVKEYVHDDNIDRSDHAVVVDWYYKKQGTDGRVNLHFCKFVGDTVLFASENEPEYKERGWYHHGKYPIEIDVMFPEADTPAGFGQIAIAKEAQMYIDKLNQLLIENAGMRGKARYFAKVGCGINEDEFLDLSKTIVHVEGDISEERLRRIEVDDLSSGIFNLLNMKIDELKETSSNHDVSQGSSASGITSGAAIAALQEAGNKTSRDMILSAYRTYTKLMYHVIELIRQFYTDARTFRIIGESGQTEYRKIDNSRLEITDDEGNVRKPVFDVVIKPQKRSAYSKLSQNELAKEMYSLGFFNPQNAESALVAIEMMDFDGKEKVKDIVSQGQTMLSQMQAMQQEIAKMAAIIQGITGENLMEGDGSSETGDSTPHQSLRDSFSLRGSRPENLTYAERLVENAQVSALNEQ